MIMLTACSTSPTRESNKEVQEPVTVIETDEHGTVHIKPVIEDIVTLPGLARAQQGTMTHPNGFYYFTENKGTNDTRVSTIYKVSSDLTEVISSFSITAADLPLWDDVSGNYHSHMGQASYNPEDGFIYVSFMDTASNRTALLQFCENTQFQRFYDWSHISPYFDAIAFQDDLFWFDYGVVSHINFDKFKAGFNEVNIEWTKYDVDHDLINTSQGIQVRDNKLYYVPENDPHTNKTLPDYRGVAVFNIPSMNARENINVNQGANYPEKLYRFQIPADGADHEAMDFVLGSTNEFYISTAQDGGATLYRVRFE